MDKQLSPPFRAEGGPARARRAVPAWLRRSPAAQIVLLLCLSLLALWTGIALELRSGLDRLQRESLQETRSLLSLHVEEARSLANTLDLNLLHLRDRWMEEGRGLFAERIRQRQMHMERSAAFQTVILDAQGRLVFSSGDPAAEGIDLSYREYFQAHRDAPDQDRMLISAPMIGRTSGRWSVQFTRRLNDASGRYAGVIVLSVMPEYFIRSSRFLELGRDSTATVMRTTGEVLARSPVDSREHNFVLKGIPARIAALGPNDSSVFEKPSDIDGIRRHFVLMSVPGHDLAISVGRSSEVLMAPYQEHRRTYLAAGATISALLLLIGQVLVSNLRQRAQAREALEQSELRWSYALEGTGNGVWDWELDTGAVYFSDRWKSMFGYAAGGIGGRVEDLRRLLHPQDKPATLSALNDYLAGRIGEYAVEFRLRHRDGSWRWVHSRGVAVRRDRRGRPQRLIGTHEDITERRQAEETMQLALLVYEHSSEGMLVMDAEGTILAVNRAFTALTGYRGEEVVGRTIDFLLRTGHPGESRHEVPWQAVLDTGHWQGEVWSRRKDGDAYAEWLSINTIFGRNGRPHRRVALFSDLARKKEYEQIIWQQAHCDPLTNLLNRRIFQERLEHDIPRAARAGRTMALLFLDLDHFKEVNDTLGHSAGDALLQEAAQRLRGCVRAGDSVARLGGDEFTIATDTADPVALARAILRRMSEPFVLGLETAFVSASIGITHYPRDGATAEILLRDADQAMYAAKGQGRNRYQEFTPSMQEAAQQRMRLAADLRAAIPGGQLRVAYQPIVELATGRIRKAEALVRWEHPARGTISPAEFIPIAEQTGVIHAIGDWVFHAVAPRLAELRRRHHPHFQVSLNKSPAQFLDDRASYEEWLRELQALGLPGDSIALEITEGLLLEATASSGLTEKLARLRDAGVQLSLDDFGTGYSSLNYLKKFAIDYLKIDQSFVRNLAEGSSDLALCRAIVAMAHTLGLRVVAEGVETLQQRDLLAAIGCDYGQGYWFSRPVPFEALEALLEEAARLP